MWFQRLSLFTNLEALRRTPTCPWLLLSSSFCSDTLVKKQKQAPLQERKMVDRFRLWAKGGDGGNGCSSFRRSRHDRRGRPDGGNGGRGGDVILECSSAIWDFRSLQHHVNAKRGGHGLSKNKVGSRGADKVVRVPVGTVIHLVEGKAPSFVENPVSMDLDPWEIPGTLELISSESDSDPNITTKDQKTSEVLERNNFNGSIKKQKVVQAESFEVCDLSSYSSNEQFTDPNQDFFSYSEEDKPVETNEDFLKAEQEGETEEEEGVEEEQIQYNVSELTEPGQRLIVAWGGEGGPGNVSLGNVPNKNKHRNVSPEVLCDEDQSSIYVGTPGSESLLILELKSIADVGLVGMPNAGKSTLLGAISRAKPTVGDYAFTTLRPNIGNLNYDDFFSVTVADIPGLIKGAHENRGLGHAFLRHIERTKVLAYVVDLAAGLDGRKGVPPWEQLKDLVLELESHQEDLSDRPSLIVANKIDENGAEDVYEELKRRVEGVPIFPICAVLEEGVAELKAGLRKLVDGEESQKLKLDRILLD